MDARTKALKSHRTRMRKRRMKRVEVTVREQDATLVRQVAAALRRDDAGARELRTIVRQVVARNSEPSIGEVLNSLTDISGPQFDGIFDDIERLRRDPVMMRVRDVDL